MQQKKKPPEFMKNPQEFLQFLYDLNIICFIEYAGEERFFRWCFLERTASNISPKVKAEMEYEIHYGLANALNTGKPLRGRRPSSREISTHPLLDYERPAADQSIALPTSRPPRPVAPKRRRTRSNRRVAPQPSEDGAAGAGTHAKQDIQSGVIKWFDNRKGYGFIVRAGLPFDVYFKRSSVASDAKIKAGQHVEFELEEDGDGRKAATNVRVTSKR